MRWRKLVPIVSNVFVSNLARADAALNAVIRNSRCPGGSKLFWGLFAGEACGSDDIGKKLFLVLNPPGGNPAGFVFGLSPY
jgi:hypothetical protein